MGNILSNNIRVFPTTQRENVDPSAKFTTEYNLTSLLNKLLDRKAFVITSDDYFKCVNKIVDSLEFNIMGYFFSINSHDLSDVITGDAGYIDAVIQITRQDYISGLAFKNWWQLSGSDTSPNTPETSNYTGITFISNDEPTFTPMLEHISDDTDIGTSHPQAVGTADNGDVVNYRFTVLQYDNLNVWIPKDSRIKFQTNTDGSQHSLAIDDGELTPADAIPQQTYNMRRPSTLSIDETFDGLSLNVSNLSLFESELFRLEAEYDKEGDVVFTSSDTNIATVSSNGLVRGVNKGTCLIVASYKDMNAVCNVTVK